MGKTKVFISDWQVLFREGIHFTLSGEEDVIVTGETTENREALDFLIGNPPDIAIVNINHGEYSGVKLTRYVRQNLPAVSVILVMDTETDDRLYEALKCGASACVSKDIDPDDLLVLIRQITEGSVPVSRVMRQPSIASRILDDFAAFTELNNEVDSLLAVLTPREQELIKRISEKNDLPDIMKDLGIGEKDVDAVLKVIRGKLEINEHCREVVEAAQRGLTSVIKRTRNGKKQDDYISRDEFESFRDSLIEHFRGFKER